MTAIPSARLLGAPFASQLKSLSTHSTLTSSSASTCFFRDRVRVRVSPDFVGGVRMSSTPSEATAPVPAEDVLVQYVVLRRDLVDAWPLGSVVTQGCHASVAAVWSHKDDPHTVDYCSPTNIDSMHNVSGYSRSNSRSSFCFNFGVLFQSGWNSVLWTTCFKIRRKERASLAVGAKIGLTKSYFDLCVKKQKNTPMSVPAWCRFSTISNLDH